MAVFRIAVIAGDGIGPEVIAQATRAADKCARADGADLVWNPLPWGSTHYKQTHPEAGVYRIVNTRTGKGLLGATLFFLLANLATDMVYGPQADRPQWMTNSRTFPLLNGSARAIVDWVETRRRPKVGQGE